MFGFVANQLDSETNEVLFAAAEVMDKEAELEVPAPAPTRRLLGRGGRIMPQTLFGTLGKSRIPEYSGNSWYFLGILWHFGHREHVGHALWALYTPGWPAAGSD